MNESFSDLFVQSEASGAVGAASRDAAPPFAAVPASPASPGDPRARSLDRYRDELIEWVWRSYETYV